MVCFLIFLTLFSYALNSVYPNELITRMLLHLSILFLIVKLMLNKIKYSKKQKISDLVATTGVMLMIPVVFLSFGAQFVGLDFSSTAFISNIFSVCLVVFIYYKIKEKLNIKPWKRQFFQLFSGLFLKKT